MPEHPTLSVCILVLARAEPALSCLASLRRQDASPPGTEFVVVANGTAPDQVERLSAEDDVVLVVNAENRGFAGGCNQAASVARATLLLFLNDDSIVEPGCIDTLLRAATADPAIGAVGPRITSVDGRLEEAGSVLWRDGTGDRVGEGLSAGSDAYGEARDVTYMSANGLLVTRRAWDAVGGFDERYYPAYFEDVDLCLALAGHGFRVRYEPKARIVHRGSQSSSDLYRQFLLDRNQRKLVEKWGPALDQFEPRPPRSSGPEFDAAVRRAVARAAELTDITCRPAGDSPAGTDGTPVIDLARENLELQTAYVAFLEQRLGRATGRVATLEDYLSRLWSVRLRRWVGGHLQRWRR